MKTFNHVASFIKTKRVQHHKGYSQEEVSSLLGFKSNKLIANIENAVCSVPLKTMFKLSEILNIDPEDLKEAILKDHQESLDRYFEKNVCKDNKEEPISRYFSKNIYTESTKELAS